MYKQNTPNYNTKYVNNFKNFKPKEEQEELGNLKRKFIHNPDDTNDLPVGSTMKFNKVTKTMQTLSKEEIIDKEEAIEELEANESLITEGKAADFLQNIKNNIVLYYDMCVEIRTGLKSMNGTGPVPDENLAEYNQLLAIEKSLNNVIYNIENK